MAICRSQYAADQRDAERCVGSLINIARKKTVILSFLTVSKSAGKCCRQNSISEPMRPNRQPHRHAKRRAHDNLVFGRQPVAELLQGDKEVDSILIQTGAQGDVLKQIRQLAVMKGVPVKSVPVEKLNRLTGGNHQGVIAFTAAISYVSIADLLP